MSTEEQTKAFQDVGCILVKIATLQMSLKPMPRFEVESEVGKEATMEHFEHFLYLRLATKSIGASVPVSPPDFHSKSLFLPAGHQTQVIPTMHLKVVVLLALCSTPVDYLEFASWQFMYLYNISW